MKKKIFSKLFLCSHIFVAALSTTLFSETEESSEYVMNKSKVSRALLDPQLYSTEKSSFIWGIPSSEKLFTKNFLLMGAFAGNAFVEWTNERDRFPILSRFPSQHQGYSGTQLVLSQAEMALLFKPINWVNAFIDFQYSEVVYPGQAQLQMRKAYVLLGSSELNPYYLLFGKKTLQFGKLTAYNPMTHTVNNHFFRVDSNTPVLELGYIGKSLRFYGTVIPAGRQLRVADSDDRSGHINNYALKASYRHFISKKSTFELGGSYLNSSIYRQNIPTHTSSGQQNAQPNITVNKRNALANVFLEYKLKPFSFMAEYTASLRSWPSTLAPVRSLTVQANYDFNFYDQKSSASFVYGSGVLGPTGKEYERLDQYIFGFETWLYPFLSLTTEYVYNKGFVPLINITKDSSSTTISHSVLTGVRMYF